MITRKVHRFEFSANHWENSGRLTRELNDRLAPAERIVSAEYIDGYYIIITESFGLGPRNSPPFTKPPLGDF